MINHTTCACVRVFILYACCGEVGDPVSFTRQALRDAWRRENALIMKIVFYTYPHRQTSYDPGSSYLFPKNQRARRGRRELHNGFVKRSNDAASQLPIVASSKISTSRMSCRTPVKQTYTIWQIGNVENEENSDQGDRAENSRYIVAKTIGRVDQRGRESWVYIYRGGELHDHRDVDMYICTSSRVRLKSEIMCYGKRRRFNRSLFCTVVAANTRKSSGLAKVFVWRLDKTKSLEAVEKQR